MLSYRMKQIAECVTAGNRLADIGTDHAFIPIYLVEQGIVPCAVALDVGEGPLLRAKEHVERHGLTGKIDCRLSDGFERLSENEVDSIIIAGMGGALIKHILEQAGEAFTGNKELILQPQSEIYKVRKILHEMCYQIVEERFIKEDGKFYNIIKALPGKQHFLEAWQYQYGVYLPQKNNECLKQFLLEKQRKLLDIRKRLSRENEDKLSLKTKERLISIKEELVEIEKCLECYNVSGTLY